MEHTAMPFGVISCESKLLITGTENVSDVAGHTEVGRNNTEIIA
jgi:hypothetical protein